MSERQEYTDKEGRTLYYDQGRRVYIDGGKDTGAEIIIPRQQPKEKPVRAKKKKPRSSVITEDSAIPTFKRSRNFLDDISIPCLVAKVKNSLLPKVARRHIERQSEDPICEIFLRGSDSTKISDWQQGMLARLLEKEELAAGIEQGMREYATSDEWAGYDEAAEAYGDIQNHGIVPHIFVSTIVIDEIRREVILSCGTECDINLSEHGIAICLRDDRWTFNYADYLSDYQDDVITLERNNRWASLNPSAKRERDEKVDDDPVFLFGVWEFDEARARTLLEQLQCSRSEVEEAIRGYKPYCFIISREEIRMKSSNLRFTQQASEKAIEQLKMFGVKSPDLLASLPKEGKKYRDFIIDDAGYQYYVHEFLGSERCGDNVTLKYRHPKSRAIEARHFFYKDDCLIDLDGLVLRRRNG